LSRDVKPERIFVGVNVLDEKNKLLETKDSAERGFFWSNKFNVVFIGTITKEKKIETVIDAISKLNNGKVDFVFHIIGDGPYKNDLQLYIQKNIQNPGSIVFHGRINKGAGEVISKCDVMVLAGLGGLAICEGMINGLPIITGKADGTEFDLVDSKNGFVIPE